MIRLSENTWLGSAAEWRERDEMIKVIIGYRVQKDADVQSVFQKLRSHAMTYPGYIGSENLRSEQDRSIVAMVQNWDRMEDWKSWETSSIRQSILKEAGRSLLEEPRVTVFRIVPTGGWGHTNRES
jgi:antibiotic biosynthesis monooxygenase (ABM) superfamily enzyme